MLVKGPAYRWRRAVAAGAVTGFEEAYSLVHAELTEAAAGSAVYAAHLQMLEDPMIKETVLADIAAGMGELQALDAACGSICAMFDQIDDEYLKARSDDVRDIFRRIREAMCGGAQSSGTLPRGCILVAEELLPSDIAGIDFSRVCGILCHKGSSTSHVCIMAHSRGIPILVGVDISGISDGDEVEVDDPLVGPSSIAAKVRAAGRKLYVNAGSIEDIRAAMEAGADGIGVFRTEFLFMGRSTMPSREEQCLLYSEALSLCGGKPLTLRLLDVGGDKAIPYMPQEKEDNPFLGIRGVRLSLRHPDILKTQLAAAFDAARDVPGELRIMIPMVCTAEEIRQVRALMEGPMPDGVRLGIMIETPAAALCAAELAAECDFFSIGTNDLTQYIMAADRGNPGVAYLYDSMSDAVMRAMKMTVEAAHAAGITAGICGELASDPRATDALIDLGLDSLSLSRL